MSPVGVTALLASLDDLLSRPESVLTSLGALLLVAILIGVFAKIKRDAGLVTRPELELELARLKTELTKEIADTRHSLRGEMQHMMSTLEDKIDRISTAQGEIGEAVARIEGMLNGPRANRAVDTRAVS